MNTPKDSNNNHSASESKIHMYNYSYNNMQIGRNSYCRMSITERRNWHCMERERPLRFMTQHSIRIGLPSSISQVMMIKQIKRSLVRRESSLKRRISLKQLSI
jgi:hypothetical protein